MGGVRSGSFTAVMPSRCNPSILCRIPRFHCSGVGGGVRLTIKSLADSFNTPVGLPWASRSMVPAGGSGVEAVMCASFRAYTVGDSVVAGGVHQPHRIVGRHFVQVGCH